MIKNLIEYFEKTCKRCPDKTAVIDGEREITFRALREAALGNAESILSIGEGCQNQPIGVFFKKSIECIVADLAITYSHNIFMNLDVKLPQARLINILELIQPALLITDEKGKKVLEEIYPLRKIMVVDLEKTVADETPIRERLENQIDTDPYTIINTSGSTGTPKGVVLNYKSFFDFIAWSTETFSFPKEIRIGSLSPVVFDIYNLELCLLMMYGATMVLLDATMAAFPVRILERLNQQKVNFLFWVPSIMVNIANMDLLPKIDLSELKLIWFAGEVFPTKQFNYWKRQLPNTVFANLYGPIEITLDCTYYIVEEELPDEEPIPIGSRCNNTEIILLNDENQRCAGNEIGEITVRGTSLAMGYYNNPEKTAKAFVQNPLNTHYPELIYRTGDLAYYNEKDELIFKGRKDSLIKHMGYRIELGEIEHILVNSLKLVEYCCVVYNFSKKAITLFYEEKDGIQAIEIKKQLATVFPRYMVPTEYIEVLELPRNTNGKIDRLALSKQINE